MGQIERRVGELSASSQPNTKKVCLGLFFDVEHIVKRKKRFTLSRRLCIWGVQPTSNGCTHGALASAAQDSRRQWTPIRKLHKIQFSFGRKAANE